MKQKKQKETKEPTFVCQRCGHCCIVSSPSLTKVDYKRIRDLPITKKLKVRFVKYNFGNRVVNNIGGKM